MTAEQAIENLETIKRTYTWSTGADEALDMAKLALRAQESMEHAKEIVHKTIFSFFDIADDDSEEHMTEKNILLLEVNKAICKALMEGGD